MAETVSVSEIIKSGALHSMPRKWQKLLEFSMEAFQATEVDVTDKRFLTFSQKIIKTMKRDRSYNQAVLDGTAHGETFLYENKPEDQISLLRSASLLMLIWELAYGRSTRNQALATPATQEKALKLQSNIEEISMTILENTSYTSNFYSAQKLQREIFSILARADTVSDEEWIAMDSDKQRLLHANKIAVATDYLVRKFMDVELPDINGTSTSQQIVDTEYVSPDLFIDKEAAIEGDAMAVYDASTGKVYFVATATDNAHILNKSQCYGYLSHEQSHRLSDILRQSGAYDHDEMLKIASYSFEESARKTALVVRGKTKDFAFIDYGLYLTNIEEICARNATANVEKKLASSVTEGDRKLAETMCILLDDGPELTREFANSIRQKFNPAPSQVLPVLKISA